MGNKLYVGNLSFHTTENELQDLFGQVGSVTDVLVAQDRTTGRSRGFGFVTMSSDAEAATAIERFNNTTLDGRTIQVNEARPREERPSFGGGGGGKFRSGGGGGGGYRGGGGDRGRERRRY